MADRRLAAGRVASLALGCVLGCFGVLELTAPSRWAGYVPPAIAAHVPVVPLVLGHGWLLLVLGVALAIDYLQPYTAWVAVGVMAEVLTGLIVTGGFSTTLVRDAGLLGLALSVALGHAPGGALRDGRPSASAVATRGGGRR